MDAPDLPDPVPAGEPPGAAPRAPRPPRRAFLGLVAGGVVALAGGAAAWRVLAEDPRPVAAGPTSTTTSPPGLQVTADTLPPLPVPDPLPANAYAATPQIVIGTIDLPRLGVTADIQEGITLTAINRGPGHWPHTAMPGELGNVVIAGHRTTYSRPFNRLDQLQPGDVVTMTTADGRFDYAVRGVVIVPGEAVDIATQTYAHTATLFACHPPGSARQRIVAKLRLLDATGAPVDPDGALPPIDAGTQETGHTLLVRPAADPLSGATG